MKTKILALILVIFVASVAVYSNDGGKEDGEPDKSNTENGVAEKTGKCPDGMVEIPPGEFMMGCDLGSATECENKLKLKPDKITTGFCMDEYEITYEKFKKVMITTLEYTNDCGPFCPILFVTYEKAREYCLKSDKRLPTEMEWEYAARGNTQTRYFWGDEMDGDYLWHKDNSDGRFQPVGLKQPNQFGLFDMLGNAYEYVYQDCENDSCDKITIRGGAYSTAEPGSSTKTSIDYDDYNSYTGFRCAKDIE